MNKDLHRIVFNPTRGLLMAVAESAAGHGGGRPGDRPAAGRRRWAGLRPLCFALAAAFGLLSWPAPAQIAVDPGAPRNQQPTVLNAANGVPQVNIQTPSGAGVSRNTYRQFDVTAQGAILNNARTPTPTTLGGWIQGNPWLAGGTAKVILNEVHSSQPSRLTGYVEVAGDRAQVVIANPAGIRCDGCGFINAHRATLTTGTPVMNGGALDGYRVQGGVVSIGGAGLDASQVDFTDLIARAVEVNAGLWARTLKITAGANQVAADQAQATPTAATGPAPAYAIDVARLGGMYAGKITLVGTEHGVGVRNAGQIGASAGEVAVTADGFLTNSGRITGSSQITLTVHQGIANSGTIYAQGNTSLSTQGDITNTALIAAQGDTALSATGATSRITSSGASILSAGLQPDNALGTSGTLTLAATESISAHGQNLSGGDQIIRARGLDLSDSQTQGRNLALTATAGDLDVRRATLSASGTFHAEAAQALQHDHARTSANQLVATAHDISNVQGELLQTGGGSLAINLPGNFDNTQGRLAANSQSLSLSAQTIINDRGHIEHAGTGRLQLTAAALAGDGGELLSNGRLELAVTGEASLTLANTSAQQIAMQVGSLSNQGGQIVQTGTGSASLDVTGVLDNAAGVIGSNGALSLSAGSFDNRGGAVRTGQGADLHVTTAGLLDNSLGGAIAAAGNATLSAQQLNNGLGQITAGGTLSANISGLLDNPLGTLAANQDVGIATHRLNNDGGILASVTGQLRMSATDFASNDQGRMEAAGNIDLAGRGFSNVRGAVVGKDIRVRTGTLAVDNSQGVIAAQGSLDVQSGSLDNRGGLLQSAGDMTLDTQGQTLDNASTASSGGLVSRGTLTLRTGNLDNTGGFIGARGTLDAHGSAITNLGQIVGQGDISLDATSLANQGGSIQAGNDLAMTLGSGTMDNTGGLLRANRTLDIAAGRIINSRTRGADQGLEALAVTLAADQLTNDDGSMLASGTLTVRSGGSLDNTRGQMGAQTLQIVDPNGAVPVSKTLRITNTGGTFLAENLRIDASRLSGDGRLLSLGDLEVRLNTDFNNVGQVVANRDTGFFTTGKVTNSGTLKAGNTFTLTAGNLDNNAAGEVSAQTTLINVSGTLNNRGLIDGGETRIAATTLNNLGTGRLYGDHIALLAGTLTNDVESGTAAVIAARNRLDLGVGTLTNREHALVYSDGDIAIGGALDSQGRATGQAGAVNNKSATIEAQGNLAITAAVLNNTNEHYSTRNVVVSTQSMDEHQGLGSPYRYPAWDAYTEHIRDSFYRWVIHGTGYDKSYRFLYTRTITETQELSSDPGQLLAAGGISLDIGTATNDKSRIIAGGAVNITGGSFTSTQVSGQRVTTDAGTMLYYIDHQPGGKNNDWTEIQYYGYNPAPTIESIAIVPSVLLANTAPGGAALSIADRTVGTVGGAVPSASAASGSVALASQSMQTGAVTQPGTQAGTAPGAVTDNRSGAVLPNNALFHQNPSPNSRVLIETDPRFADYRTWISSDYLLQQLSIDPATMQKRLGDGFYEQKLVREQIAQLTGRRFLEGYASDEAQFRALMDAGVTLARAWHLRPGVALSAAQMARLTSDIVWLVEKDVVLADGSHQKVLMPQVYLMPRPEDLAVSGALVSGNALNLDLTGDLANSGTLAGRQLISLTAENLRNLGGTITGERASLAARTDLDNLGGRIAAASALNLQAGRDLNVLSTTRTQSTSQGSRTNIDRVAGLYVTGPGGTLTALAGRDAHFDGAKIANAGGGTTTLAAGNNLSLGTVKESDRFGVSWDSRNYLKQSASAETGTQIKATGDLTLVAGNDLSARAAAISSDQGAVTLGAGRDVSLTAGEHRVTLDTASYVKDKSAFSTRTRTTRDSLDQTTAQGTTVSGETVTIGAGQDLRVRGSNVVSTQDTKLAAGRDLTIEAARENLAQTHIFQQKSSGLMSSGGIGFTLGSRQTSTDTQGTGDTAAISTVGATHGNVVLTAGRDYRQVGSDVLAPNGDIAIAGRRVSIEEARETRRSATETRTRQSGLTVALTSPVISAVQTTRQMQKAARDTRDPRMQALAAANGGFAAKNAMGAVQAGQGGSAARQAGGVNISLSVGSSQSRSTRTQQSDSAAGSAVTAGGDVTLAATGAGKDSHLIVQGSRLTAGKDLTLAAENRVDLRAAANTATLRSTNASSSASVGVSLGTDGFLVNVGASRGKGQANGDDLTWTHTRAEAGNTLTLRSGGDTALRGAVATGERVVADVGGHLAIESLQDQSTYDSRQQNLGVSVSCGGHGRLDSHRGGIS